MTCTYSPLKAVQPLLLVYSSRQPWFQASSENLQVRPERGLWGIFPSWPSSVFQIITQLADVLTCTQQEVFRYSPEGNSQSKPQGLPWL